MEFKVGDRVRIKSFDEIMDTLRNIDSCYLPGFIDEKMGKYCDKYAKVIAFHDIHPDKWVFLNIDNKTWVWDKRWLERQPVIQLNDNLFEL